MYKRFIIYLYYYKNEEKKENCGYAKVNIQNEECRIEINIRNVPRIEGPEILYLLKKKDNRWKKKQILETTAEQGVINVRHVCKFSEMADDFSAGEIQGLLVYDGKNIQKAVCGVLNNEEITLSDVQEIQEALETKTASQSHIEEPVKKSKEVLEVIENSRSDKENSAKETRESNDILEIIENSENYTRESAEESKGSKEVLETIENSGNENNGNKNNENENNGNENYTKELRTESKEALETAEINQDELKTSAKEDKDMSENSVYEYDEECLKKKAENEGADCTEEIEIESCCTSLNDKENMQTIAADTWQEKMFRVFPKVILNINGEKTMAIKLKPHDIVWFPGAYWRLASNKFLLNGYYNYRYIIFFQGNGEYKGRYFLGTPGYFGVSDAMTAKKFGFTDFFMAGDLSTENEGRNFGFWCRET